MILKLHQCRDLLSIIYYSDKSTYMASNKHLNEK